MAELKRPKAKAQVMKKSTKPTKSKTPRLGSSKVRSVEKRNMVALNEKVIDHMKLKVGDVVSYIANEDGTVTIRKAVKGKRKKVLGK